MRPVADVELILVLNDFFQFLVLRIGMHLAGCFPKR